MSRKIHEDNDESKARASPRGGVCRKPATARRGEEHERQSRLTALGRGGTTQQSPVNRGSGKCRACAATTHGLIRGELSGVLGSGGPRKLTESRSNPL